MIDTCTRMRARRTAIILAVALVMVDRVVQLNITTCKRDKATCRPVVINASTFDHDLLSTYI